MRSPFRSNDVLVDALKRKDEKAVTYFLRRYRHGLYIFCAEDEDITLEAIETAIFTIEKYEPAKSTFITWVYGIAKNLLRRTYREKQRLDVIYAEDLLENYNDEDTGGDEREEWIKPNSNTSDQFPDLLGSLFLDDEFKQEINQAIAMLTKEQRSILKDYCEKKKPKSSPEEQKRVFKQLRKTYRRFVNRK